MSDWMNRALQEALDFSNVLNTSISVCWVILAILLLRLMLKKAPRWISAMLWGIAALRLLIPFSIESTLSLLPSAQPVSAELLRAGPLQGAAPAYLEIVTNPSYGTQVTMELNQSIGSFQLDLLFMTFIWLFGAALMMLYAIISYARLRNMVKTAVRLRDNLYQCETVGSPFVLGILRPKIYLPYGIKEQELDCVVAHEQAHIRRKDHWWKPLGFFLLSIHWFNPLVWLGYVLMCRDLELACDEKVIRELGNEQRADYTQALVSCSINRRRISACPLAFGEVGVKARVKSVLHYKKPTFWAVAAALAVCGITAVCLLTDPVVPEPDLSFLNYENAISLVADMDEVMAIYCPSSDDTSGALIQVGAAAGADLAKQLDRWEWKQCKPPRDSLPSPGSVEFVIEEDYRITVHQKKSGAVRQYAVVTYQDGVRYYQIDRSDYPDAVALVHAPPKPTKDIEDDTLVCYAESDGINSYIEPSYYENGFDWDYDHVAWGEMYSSGTLTFTADWDTEELVVGENYYERTGATSVMIYQETRTLMRNADGKFVLNVDYRNPGTDEMAVYFIQGETKTEKYVMKIVFGEREHDAVGEPEELQDSPSYFLTIGKADVKTIAITTLDSSGGCENADGSLYQKGERVWLEPLDSCQDLQGATITAKDRNGSDVFSVRISDYYDPEHPDAPIVCGEWILEPVYH